MLEAWGRQTITPKQQIQTDTKQMNKKQVTLWTIYIHTVCLTLS